MQQILYEDTKIPFLDFPMNRALRSWLENLWMKQPLNLGGKMHESAPKRKCIFVVLFFGSVSLTLVGWRLAEVVDELLAGDSSLVTPDRRDSCLDNTQRTLQKTRMVHNKRYSYYSNTYHNMSVVRESSTAKIDHHNATFTQPSRLSSLLLSMLPNFCPIDHHHHQKEKDTQPQL
jgi:hypothetical protein